MTDWGSIIKAVNENNMNRILILSLGTGNLRAKKDAPAKAIYEKGNDDVYRTANYQFFGDEEIVVSRFVAEPLIKKLKPDTVIMVGTVKSAWSEIYREYYGEKRKKCDEKLFTELYEKESEYGIYCSEDELDRFEDRINEIYNDGQVFKDICPRIKVRVILTKYGVTTEELADNYHRISRLRDYLREDVINSVSFDITHSFRSMPLYNLIVLNYFSNISRSDVRIEHIYYGNLDISSEYNNIAGISDLAELSNVLSLTNAISDFRNSGNAKAVITLLPEDTDQRKKIKKTLEEFDWATQINDLKNMEMSLGRLIKALEKELEVKRDRSEKFLDIYNMISDTLKESFPNIQEFDKMNSLDEYPYCYGQIQTKLGMWFMMTNRYGQAVLIATEAVRSFLVPIYLIRENKKITRETCAREENRKEGEKMIDELLNSNLLSSESKQMLGQLIKMKKMRNVFAHNIPEKESYENEYIEPQKFIKNFYEALYEFGMELQEKWSDIVGCYTDPALYEIHEIHEMKITGKTNTRKQFRGRLENGSSAMIPIDQLKGKMDVQSMDDYMEKTIKVKLTGYNKNQNSYDAVLAE